MAMAAREFKPEEKLRAPVVVRKPKHIVELERKLMATSSADLMKVIKGGAHPDADIHKAIGGEKGKRIVVDVYKSRKRLENKMDLDKIDMHHLEGILEHAPRDPHAITAGQELQRRVKDLTLAQLEARHPNMTEGRHKEIVAGEIDAKKKIASDVMDLVARQSNIMEELAWGGNTGNLGLSTKQVVEAGKTWKAIEEYAGGSIKPDQTRKVEETLKSLDSKALDDILHGKKPAEAEAAT